MIDVKKSMRDHYEAFYLMTLSAAFLNSAALGEFERDAEAVLSFISRAYGLDDETAGAFAELILGDMMKIGLPSDYHALSSIEDLSDADRDKLIFYEIKGRVIEEVNRSDRRGYVSANSRLSQEMKAGMKYESFHHDYDPVVRFESLKFQAGFGDLNSTRQLALLYALGIGTARDPGKARMHLERCVMWGNAASAVLLREVCIREQDADGAKEFGELYRLEKEYMEDGVIHLPESVKADEAVRDRYLCIALVKYCLVAQGKAEEIDIAFLNALAQPGLSLRTKLKCISRYKDFIWKSALWGAARNRKESGNAGFRTQREEKAETAEN